MTLFAVEKQRHLNIEVNSRRGNIALLIPPAFSGAIQLRTKRGSLTFLPNLAQHMRVLKTTENEALVLFGTSQTSLDTSTADYCELTSRFGSVTVGLAGADKYTSAEHGFWKKFGGYLMTADMKKEANGEI